MKPYVTFRLWNLSLDVGCFKFEDWKLFELTILDPLFEEYEDESYISYLCIFKVHIIKFIFLLSWSAS